jgi:hypothetical protein
MSNLKELQETEEIENEELEEKEVEPIKKVKKPRSQKQIDAFEKAKIKLAENNKLRNEAKKQMEEETKNLLNVRLLKKH